MIEPLDLDGVVYTSSFIEDLREGVIVMRNEALNHDAFNSALLLTHVIASLHHLSQHTKSEATE